jgi:hypothetical protein
MFTNYEAAVIHDFAFPSDRNAYNDLYKPLQTFFDPEGPTIQNLTPELISILKLRGLITSEQKARQKNQNINPSDQNKSLPANPFTPVAVPLPPLLPKKVRDEEPVAKTNKSIKPLRAKATNLIPKGLLVWKKKLPKSDALQVSPGTHHVGGVRLTQAHFESPKGHPIDQTTYFRNLFRDFQWELEKGKHADQEHTFVPIHVFIKDKDYGIRHFEISHKPSGEAGQANYTTILRWGSEFTPTIQSENITNLSLYLYDTPSADAPYLIEIK